MQITEYQQNTPPVHEVVDCPSGLFNILSGYNHELFYSNFLKFIYLKDKEYFINVLVRLFGGNGLTKDFFNHCELRREYLHLDLSFIREVVSRRGNTKEEVVLIIENKFKSLPEQKQLDQYVKTNPRVKHLFLLSLLPAVDERIYVSDEKHVWHRYSYGQLADALNNTPVTKFDDFERELLCKFINHIRNIQALADKYTDGTYTLKEYFQFGYKSCLPIRLPYCAILQLMNHKLSHSTLKEVFTDKSVSSLMQTYINATKLGGLIGMEYDCEQEFERNETKSSELKKIRSKGYVMQLQGEWLFVGIYAKLNEKSAPKAERKNIRQKFYDSETTLRNVLEAEFKKVDFETDYKLSFKDSDGRHGFTTQEYNLVKLKTANVSHIPVHKIADLLLKIVEIFKESADKYQKQIHNNLNKPIKRNRNILNHKPNHL